ncbi:EcoRII-like protein [Nocardioides sp. J9]|nr:EcoRII-like protein [Nocardioides sp. J9]
MRLADDAEPLLVDDTATWYDARARHPTRSEFRFYYPAGNAVMALTRPGDYVVIARTLPGQERDLVVVVTDGKSSMAAQLEAMFGLEPSETFDVETVPSGEDLTFSSRRLLEALGYEVEFSDERFLEDLLNRFGHHFPSTATFSAYARSTLPDISPLDDPDAALLAWWDREEVLFRTFERYVLGQRIAEAGGDIDSILQTAMSAFQRRKSRAGHALENHVAEILRAWQVPFDAQPRTEGKVRPDFLIPGAAEYHDPAFPADRLHMLAVKTTCKDRWRQILSEAARVPVKHLLTLEAPISRDQLVEMQEQLVVLVVPAALHALFGQRELAVIGLAEMIHVFGRDGPPALPFG